MKFVIEVKKKNQFYNYCIAAHICKKKMKFK